jgi:hypothetical protein
MTAAKLTTFNTGGVQNGDALAFCYISDRPLSQHGFMMRQPGRQGTQFSFELIFSPAELLTTYRRRLFYISKPRPAFVAVSERISGASSRSSFMSRC